MGSNTSKFFGLLLLSSMLQISPSFADGEVAAAPADGKMYVKRRAIHFGKNEIIIVNKDGAFAAKTLLSDENGLYVQKAELEKVNFQHGKGRKDKARYCLARKNKPTLRHGKGKGRKWRAPKESTKPVVTSPEATAPVITK